MRWYKVYSCCVVKEIVCLYFVYFMRTGDHFFDVRRHEQKRSIEHSAYSSCCSITPAMLCFVTACFFFEYCTANKFLFSKLE
jgi:hypothetical protein